MSDSCLALLLCFTHCLPILFPCNRDTCITTQGHCIAFSMQFTYLYFTKMSHNYSALHFLRFFSCVNRNFLNAEVNMFLFCLFFFFYLFLFLFLDFQHKITVQASPSHDRRRSLLSSGSSPPTSPPILPRLRAIQRRTHEHLTFAILSHYFNHRYDIGVFFFSFFSVIIHCKHRNILPSSQLPDVLLH